MRHLKVAPEVTLHLAKTLSQEEVHLILVVLTSLGRDQDRVVFLQGGHNSPVESGFETHRPVIRVNEEIDEVFSWLVRPERLSILSHPNDLAVNFLVGIIPLPFIMNFLYY